MTDDIEICCLCPKNKPESGTWICCDVCETWYHARCLKMSIEEFEAIDSYHCAQCAPKAGPSTLLRKSSRKQGKINYADLVNGIVSHQSKWRVLLDSHQFLVDKFDRVQGKDVTMDWMRATGFKAPIIVKGDQANSNSSSSGRNNKRNSADEDKEAGTGAAAEGEAGEGLEMKMPPKTLTVDDVRDAVGEDTAVEVIDVATQSELSDWSMGLWADYFKTEPKERVYNVISLEISGTPLADKVQRPRVVRELDWIDNFWPKELRAKEFPKVQLYCLMSVKDSFTDFHIDFAGSSVFYHILSGSKTFYFVEPTSTHLRKYAKWSSSADQSTTFFSDEVSGKCTKVELQQGDTMLIPAGWIHAVYTPSSSVVIGGNFIHSLHIPMQYRVADIEIETNVSPKFRFPYFEKLNWFVALGSLERGQDYLSTLSTMELKGLLALTTRLYNRLRGLKRDPNLSKEERHMIRASIPPEASNFSDGGSLGLLRQLNWSVYSILQSAQVQVDADMRLLSEEEEAVKKVKLNAAGNGPPNSSAAAPPKIKLRIKLSSTPSSSTHSGDEESSSTTGENEQQVPTLCSPVNRSASTLAPPESKTSPTTKLKFKIPILASATASKKETSRSKKDRRVDSALEENDLGDSDMEGGGLDPMTDDDEWTDFQSQIDEGFGEGKDEDEDESLDDGQLLDSSDSEYDEGGWSSTPKRARSSRKGRNNGASASAGTGISIGTSTSRSGSLSSVPIAPSVIIASKPRMKRSSTETVFFGDVEDHIEGPPLKKERASHENEENGDEDDGEVVLGLGKQRKAAMPGALMSNTSSLSSTSSSSGKKRPATAGRTAKDRIKSLLMKRR
ncbi:JmjC domain-containing histone demethylation protein 1 [Mortierella alpina]|nr:JmjC domain-containing histone demethylation protein 1 [Mortierella alpina]